MDEEFLKELDQLDRFHEEAVAKIFGGGFKPINFEPAELPQKTSVWCVPDGELLGKKYEPFHVKYPQKVSVNRYAPDNLKFRVLGRVLKLSRKQLCTIEKRLFEALNFNCCEVERQNLKITSSLLALMPVW